MSATKEAMIVLGELSAMHQYATEQEAEGASPKDIKFYDWAIHNFAWEIIHQLKIHPDGLQEFCDLHAAVLDAYPEMLAEHNRERVEVAERLFNYYRQAYKMEGLA